MNLPRLLLCLLLTGCGQGASPSTEPADTLEPVSAVSAQAEPAHGRIEAQGPAPFLSRYAPNRGVIGTKLTILGSFAEKAADNRVTIGGVQVMVLPNDFLLEVEVTPGAVSGPLCVTANGQTVCGEDFTLLAAPVIYAVSAEPHARADATLQLTGDGFLNSSTVLLDGLPLETAFSSYGRLEAALPVGVVAGTHQISVKNGLRCGAESLPFPLTLP